MIPSTCCSTFYYLPCQKCGQCTRSRVFITTFCQKQSLLVRKTKFSVLGIFSSPITIQYNITYISGLIMDNCINYSPNCAYRFHLLHIGHHRGTLSHRLSSLFRYISSMVIKKIHNTYCDIFVGKFYHMSTVAT